MAIALRIEMTGKDKTWAEERTALPASTAPLVDVFDVAVPDYTHEVAGSRCVKEASRETQIAHVRGFGGALYKPQNHAVTGAPGHHRIC